MSTKKKQLSQQFNLTKLLLLLIPLAAYVLPGLFFLGTTDTNNVLRFSFTLILFAAASYPLAVMLFPLSSSGGYTCGKPLGLLASGLAVWTLAYLKIGRFNLLFIIISVLALTFCCWFPKSLREGAIDKLKTAGTIENIAVEETVFALVITLLCFFKGMNPDINGQEKFMDYGFMMSMIRNPELPANDIWLSGYSINYYYFGQYLYAFITKLSMIKTGVAYNISMCCSIALPFSLCFGIGRMLIDGAREQGAKIPKFIPTICGIITAAAVCLFGNSHSFFYDPDSIGNGLLGMFKSWGIEVGTTDHFFYPDSTRFIGHNPDTSLIPDFPNGGDKTIEEFPFYSYLVGDLHAHVCSTIVVLLIFAIAITLISKVFKIEEEKTEVSHLLRPEIITIGILLGICQMTNYWDYLIYFIFGSMLLLVFNTYKSKAFSSIPGVAIFVLTVGGILGIYLTTAYHPILHAGLQVLLFAMVLLGTANVSNALTRTAAGMSFFFTTATIVSLPFNSNFEMISNKLAACVNHSPLYQLYILWGTHVFICVTFIVFIIIFRNINIDRSKKGKEVSIEYDNPIEKFFKERNPVDVFICGSIIVGIMLLIAPEIFYVRDIYTGGYLRSNTMFKFTYAGFIMLSICMVYSVFRLMFITNKKGDYNTPAWVISIVFCFLLLIPAHYTYPALSQRCGELTRDRYKTLDGTAYIEDYVSPYTNHVVPGNLSDYEACIEWFNENVEGDPVILEAYGLSYTDYNIVSAYTGLPTVCGWQTHEWLWRFHGIVDEETDLFISDPDRDVWELYLTPRHTDIDTMYTSNDPGTVLDLLHKYNVTYVVIGDLERDKYSGLDNTAMFAQFGRVAFISGDLMVVEIWD